MKYAEIVSAAQSRMTGESKGQGLVEFAVLIVMVGLVALMAIDPALYLFDISVAKVASGRGARAAAVYMPDGTRTCWQDAINGIGNLGLIMAEHTETVTDNCNGNPLDTHAVNEWVMVEVEVTYTPFFWGGPWVHNAVTWEQAR